MASTKMTRNLKQKKRAVNSLPWLEKERLLDIQKHKVQSEYIKEFAKVINHG